MEKLGADVAKMISSFHEFGPGVPASDKVCLALLEVLTKQWQQTHDDGANETVWVHDKEAQNDYELEFEIGEAYTLELSRTEEECRDGWKPLVVARFREKARPSGTGIAPSFSEDFTPKACASFWPWRRCTRKI